MRRVTMMALLMMVGTVGGACGGNTTAPEDDGMMDDGMMMEMKFAAPRGAVDGTDRMVRESDPRSRATGSRKES